MDSRLLRIGTHDAIRGSILEKGAGFTVNLGNVLSQIQANVYGFSIESCGFWNLARNVQTDQSDKLHITVQDVSYTITVPQNQYKLETLLTVINAQILQTIPVSIIISETALDSGYLRFDTLVGTPISIHGENYLNSTSNQLATNLGVPIGGTISTNTGTLFFPNHCSCGGEHVAFLHSDTLVHNRHSVDGEGLPVSMVCSLPITEWYNSHNIVYPNQYKQSTVSWEQTYEIREIRLRLRNIRGQLLDLQGTEWWVVLRLFLI